MFEFSKTLEKIVEDVFIPISAGGGIRSIEDAELLFNSGADKIVINTILVEDNDLVTRLVKKFGSQSIVASVDYRSDGVYINNGTVKIDKNLKEYLEDIELLGVGEIYLNSIDKDGTGFGYDLSTIENIIMRIKSPLIIAGGAGNEMHLAQGLNMDYVNAVATANLFNFIGDSLKKSRESLLRSGQKLAFWDDRIKDLL
jgi:cyclase